MTENPLKKVERKLGRLIMEAASEIDPTSPQAFGLAISTVKDAIVEAFEEYIDMCEAQGEFEGNDFFKKLIKDRNNPTQTILQCIKKEVKYIAAAFTKTDSETYKYAHSRGGGSFDRVPAEDIRPEFSQIVSNWGTLQKVCRKAAVKAFWELYNKYKNYVSEDFTTPNDNITDHRRHYLYFQEEIEKYKKLLDETPKGAVNKYGDSLRKQYYDSLKHAQERQAWYGERGGAKDPLKAWDRWRNEDGGVNTMMMRLDFIFKQESQKGKWCGAYKTSFVQRIDENNLGWAISQAIKDAIAKIHNDAWNEKKAEDDEWYRMMAKDTLPKGSSGNAMVDAQDWEDKKKELRRRGIRF